MRSVDDDATELAELRRRAYGPDADIASDPSALARLVVLEDAARAPASNVHAAPGPPDGDIETAPTPRDSAVSAPTDATRVSGRRQRPPWHSGLVLGVAAVAIVLASIGAEAPALPTTTAAASTPPAPDPFGSASPFHGDLTAHVLTQVPTDGTLDALGPPDPPTFPIAEDLRWSSSLGNHYGWDLWLARSRSGFPCLALARDGEKVRADCILPSRFDEGALVVTLPYEAIPSTERPEGMAPFQSVGFAWLTDDEVSIILGWATDPPAP